MVEKEVWKPVVGYEGLYEVSNFGRVASLNYHLTGKRHLLSSEVTKNGYFRVVLCKNGEHKHKSVHRLVAEAFIPNPEKKPEVDHIDTNPKNNKVENLKWATISENHKNPLTVIHHKENDYKRIEIVIKRNSKKVYQYTLDGIFVAEFPSAKDAASKNGLHKSTITSCCNPNDRHKSAGGYICKYAG